MMRSICVLELEYIRLNILSLPWSCVCVWGKLPARNAQQAPGEAPRPGPGSLGLGAHRCPSITSAKDLPSHGGDTWSMKAG